MPSPNTVPHARPEADSADAAHTRRRFLMGAAVAAAAAGTAATAGHLVQAPTAPATPATDAADDGATGYRLSEHIRKYYKTTWI
ncbi:twin-arginine translocation signal domain-containing protein [Ralstonia sp.]|uniref:twin-arginine translocation signal domain-containing protein n=1 Tax=Ralstonia sp. TaxID=54061 RepID=UPI0031E265D8